jgi:hypothetical protein
LLAICIMIGFYAIRRFIDGIDLIWSWKWLEFLWFAMMMMNIPIIWKVFSCMLWVISFHWSYCNRFFILFFKLVNE